METNHKELVRLILAAIIGAGGYGIHILVNSPLIDPLVVSLILGIMVRALFPDIGDIEGGLSLPTRVFIPIGLVLYSAHNLNFTRFAEVHLDMAILLLLVMAVYFLSIIISGRVLGQKREITYLIANGSAICGASAIVITSPAVDAEPDDVSISLLSVTITAMTALFIIFPFIATISGMTDRSYGILSGMVLQFTGFIRIAVGNIPYLERVMSGEGLLSLALSVKAVRYLGLLISIPIFASMIKGRFQIPLVLWIFLIPGIAGTLISRYDEYLYSEIMIPFIRPVHVVSWSIALSAIGLNADIRGLFSNNGAKALIMAFTGFFSAMVVFFIGYNLLRTLSL
jgi:uncharacterized integral membrane protein (TIGR00698 family)